MRIMAIGAHPDDVELSMFGLLATCRARGDEIDICIMTDGAPGQTPNQDALRECRRGEAEASARLLGVVPQFLGSLDGSLTDAPEWRARTQALIKERGPDLIVTHCQQDYHPDHRATHDIVFASACFEAPILLAEPIGGHSFEPNYFLNIDEHIGLKQQAIAAHKSQDPDRLIEIANVTARFRSFQASGVAKGFAEAYRFEATYPFGSVKDLLP